jgi:excisionase family DNA binding protein
MQQHLALVSLLTLPEAAQRLRISRSSLYRLIGAGALPSVHVGARHLVSTRALEAYIQRLEDGSHDRESGTRFSGYSLATCVTTGCAAFADHCTMPGEQPATLPMEEKRHDQTR